MIRQGGKSFFSMRFLRDTVVATFFSSAGKAIGFLVPFFLATWFGSTVTTDAFFFIYSLMLFLASIVASTVSSVIVPYITEYNSRKEDSGAFVTSILFFGSFAVAILLAAAGLLLFLFLGLVPLFQPEINSLIISMFLELIPLVLCLVVVGVLEGTLVAGKRFVSPGLGIIVRSVVTIGVIFLFKDLLGMHAVVAGYVAGELVRLALLMVAVRAVRLFRLDFSFAISKELRDFFRKAAFQVIGFTAIALNPFIDKAMAAWFPRGSVSLLYYAERFFMIPNTLVTGGIMVTLYSYWSSRFHKLGLSSLKADVGRTAIRLSVVGIIITGIFIAFVFPLTQLAYGQGGMSQVQKDEIALIAVAYFAGFMPSVVAQVYVRALLILKNTRALSITALVMSAGNVGLNLLFMSLMGVAGIAWATSTMYCIGLALAFSFFHATARKLAEKGQTPVEEPDFVPPLEL